ncbi:MAG TPA: glycolate oxidase subunit GlcE [Burkholderiaceae bacterium]|nr:glycolate oxidase subunit GlcE [Burkholderiaceae bacterium]
MSATLEHARAPAIEPTLARIVDQVRAATASSTPLRIAGGGSKAWLGAWPQGEALDVREHAGIVEYEPSELVITARAGTPLREIEDVLNERRQMLAFEPPHFTLAPGANASEPARLATIGGVVAAGLSGPRRTAYGPASGAVRDFVLGARLVDGRGDVLRFGGVVMKNVAGYDVSRLLAGSFGVLGVIADVSLKVLPLPAVERTLQFELSEARAIRQINAWAGQPLPLSASVWRGRRDGVLSVRLSGAAAAVDAASAKLGGERLADDQAHTLWRDVREQRDALFGAASDSLGALWRLSLPSVTPPLEIETGERIVEWGGAQRWIRSTLTPQRVREAVVRAGGHATLWRWTGEGAPPPWMTPLPAVNLTIHRRLKAEFDPANIFNRGRLYADL